MPLKDFVHYRQENGPPTMVGETTVTPQAQVLSFHWPNGGWVWNRPVAVLVEKDGQSVRYPIINVTRYAQIGLIAFTAVIGVIAFLSQIGRTASRK